MRLDEHRLAKLPLFMLSTQAASLHTWWLGKRGGGGLAVAAFQRFFVDTHLARRLKKCRTAGLVILQHSKHA